MREEYEDDHWMRCPGAVQANSFTHDETSVGHVQQLLKGLPLSKAATLRSVAEIGASGWTPSRVRLPAGPSQFNRNKGRGA